MVKEVLKMCRAAMVLDTIKKTKNRGGMTAAQVKLAEAQAEDYADMKREIQDIKSDVSDLKKEFYLMKNNLSTMSGSLDTLVKLNEHKQFMQIVLELIKCKPFWFIVGLIVIGVFGMNLGDLRGLIGR